MSQGCCLPFVFYSIPIMTFSFLDVLCKVEWLCFEDGRNGCQTFGANACSPFPFEANEMGFVVAVVWDHGCPPPVSFCHEGSMREAGR